MLVRNEGANWFVVASTTDNLQLDTPTTNDVIASPQRLAGRSVAFEGTVRVTLLTWGTSMRCVPATDTCGSEPRVLYDDFFTGHGSELTPFETTISFNPREPRPAC